MIPEIKTQKDFEAALMNAGSKLVVIDFTATWCGPCKMISPIFKQISEMADYKNKAFFYKCNVDEAQDVAKREGINAMPTFKFYVNGKFLDEIRGANSQGLKDKVKQLVGQYSG